MFSAKEALPALVEWTPRGRIVTSDPLKLQSQEKDEKHRRSTAKLKEQDSRPSRQPRDKNNGLPETYWQFLSALREVLSREDIFLSLAREEEQS